MVSGKTSSGFLLWLIVLLLIAQPALAATTAHLNSNVVMEGEVVQLVVDTDQDEEPDWTPLAKDFDIAGTGRSSQIQVINGQFNSSVMWTVNLIPKRIGVLMIPGLVVGDERTAPLTVTINEAGKSASVSGAKDIFVEVAVSPAQAYVRQQLIYTISLFQAVDIREGSLTKPELSNAVVEKLGDDQADSVIRDGVRYRVTKRQFAIFPQASGKLEIPPAVFNGQVVSGQRSRRSFGGFDPFDRFFQQTKAVRLKSEPVSIEVLPQPQEAVGDWWLPVSKLSLKQSWSPADPEFKVGEPVTRAIKIEALGATDSQLPDIHFDDNSQMKFYPDQPQATTLSNGSSLVATKEFKIAMIPLASGDYVIPELRIPWWNTRTNKREVAILPQQTVTVAGGGAGTQDKAATELGQTPAPESVGTGVAQSPTADKAVVKSLPWLVPVLLLLWLLTVMAWWWDRRRYGGNGGGTKEQQTGATPSMAHLYKTLTQACMDNDAKEAARAVIQCVREITGDSFIQNLGQVVEQVENKAVQDAVNGLQDFLYSRAATQWEGQAFHDVVLPALKAQAEQGQRIRKRAAVSNLPALYS